MKKLGMLLFLFMFSVTLSGCDLLDENFIDDVMDGIDDLDCEENPDDELCKIISPSVIEEATIYELIYSVLNDDFDMNLEENCQLVIVPSNVELIEECTSGAFIFFAEDVAAFNPTSFNNDGDVYTVTGTTSVEREQLTITLEVVEYEDTYRIASWSLIRGTLSDEIALDDVYVMYAQYLEDYMNLEVDFEDLIWTYYRSTNTTNFFETRLEQVATLESKDLSHIVQVTDSTFNVYYHINTQEEVINMGLLIEVFEDDDGLFFSFIEEVDWEDSVCDETVENCHTMRDMVEALYKAYLIDYVELDVESDDFLWTYFRAEPEPVFEEMRYDELADGLELQFARVIERSNGVFEAFHIATIYGEETKVGFSLEILEDEEGYYFRFIEPVDFVCDEAVGDCDEPEPVYEVEDVEALYSSYLEDYMNHGIHADEIRWMYHRESSAMEYTLNRIQTLEIIDKIVFTHIEAVSDNTFEVYEIVYMDTIKGFIGYLITVDEDEEGLYFTIGDTLDYVEDYCGDKGSDCSEDVYELYDDSVKDMFVQYLSDYLNPEVPVETLLWTYFRTLNDAYLSFYEDYRNEEIATYDSLDFSHIIKVSEDRFKVYYHATNADEVLNVARLIEVYVDEEGFYFSVVDEVPWQDHVCDQATEDCGLYKKEDIEALYTQYLKDYLNLDVYGNDLIWTYYRATNATMFLQQRNQDAVNYLGFPFSHLIRRSENIFEVYYYVVEEHAVYKTALEIEILEDSEGVYFEIVGSVPWQEDGCTLEEEGCIPENREVITTFFSDFTNSYLRDETILSDYFNGESVPFMDIRDNYTINGSMLSISSILENPDGSFDLVLVDFNGTYDSFFYITITVDRYDTNVILTITDS